MLGSFLSCRFFSGIENLVGRCVLVLFSGLVFVGLLLFGLFYWVMKLFCICIMVSLL